MSQFKSTSHDLQEATKIGDITCITTAIAKAKETAVDIVEQYGYTIYVFKDNSRIAFKEK